MAPGFQWCLKRSPRGTRQNLVVSMPCTCTGRLCGCGLYISSQFSGPLMDILTLKTPQTQTDQGMGKTQPEVEMRSNSPSSEVWPEATLDSPSDDVLIIDEARSCTPSEEAHTSVEARSDTPLDECQITTEARSGAPLDECQITTEARAGTPLDESQITTEARSGTSSDENLIVGETGTNTHSYLAQRNDETRSSTPSGKIQTTVKRTSKELDASLCEKQLTIETPIEFTEYHVENKLADKASRMELNVPCNEIQPDTKKLPMELGQGESRENNFAAFQDAIDGSTMQAITTATVEMQKRLNKRQQIREKRMRQKLKKRNKRLALLMESEAKGDNNLNISSQIPNIQDSNSKSKLDISTPSPKNLVAKTPRKTLNPGPNHSGNSIKVAIVKDSFPTGKLNKEEVDIIQMEVLRKIDMIPVDDHLPRIQNSSLSAGAMIFICDSETAEWLKIAFHDNTQVINGTSLKVRNADDVLRYIKVAFRTKDKISNSGDFLRRLGRFNPELNTNKWRVLNRVVGPASVNWFFSIDQESVEAIKKAKFGGYTGLDWGVFKILKGKGNSGSIGNTVPSPNSSCTTVNSKTISVPDFPLNHKSPPDTTGQAKKRSHYSSTESHPRSFPGSKKPRNNSTESHFRSFPGSKEPRNNSAESHPRSFPGSKEPRNNSYQDSTDPHSSAFGSKKPHQTSNTPADGDTDYRLRQTSPGYARLPPESRKPWFKSSRLLNLYQRRPFSPGSKASGKKRPGPSSTDDSAKPHYGSSRGSITFKVRSPQDSTGPYQTAGSTSNTEHGSHQSLPPASTVASEQSPRQSSPSSLATAKAWPNFASSHSLTDLRRSPFYNSNLSSRAPTEPPPSSSLGSTEPHPSSRGSTEAEPSSSNRSIGPRQTSASTVDVEHLTPNTSSSNNTLSSEPFNTLRRLGSTNVRPNHSSAQAATETRNFPSDGASEPRQFSFNRTSEPRNFTSNRTLDPSSFSFQNTAPRRVTFRGSTRPRQTSSALPDPWINPCGPGSQWPRLALPTDACSFFAPFPSSASPFPGSIPPLPGSLNSIFNSVMPFPNSTGSFGRSTTFPGHGNRFPHHSSFSTATSGPQSLSPLNSIPVADRSPVFSDPDDIWSDHGDDF